MPTITPGSNEKVLVSGANGYIAVWVVRVLLERGYSVRGTVRSEEKGHHLKELFKEYADKGKFEIAVVEDNVKDGAFDEAVKGVDAIAHTASPFHTGPKSADELIQPAVKGTVGILESTLKNGGSSIKRILILASCASVLEPGSDKVFTEEDWNEASIRTIKEKGDQAPGIEIYRASKTLAEKAAWDFYNKNKSSLSWDLTVLNPPFVFGPPIHSVGSSPSSLNTSAQQWYDVVVRGTLSSNKDPATSPLATQGSAWIDVRDLAEAHARALEKPAAGNERIIVSAGSFVWQEWIDVVRSIKPGLPEGLEEGTPKYVKYPIRYRTEKEKRVLGVPFRTMEVLSRDTLKDFEERGW